VSAVRQSARNTAPIGLKKSRLADSRKLELILGFSRKLAKILSPDAKTGIAGTIAGALPLIRLDLKEEIMTAVQSFVAHRAGTMGAFAALLVSVAAAHAQPVDTPSTEPAGRINLGHVDLPPATVEVDLSREMFSDLFGLGDAAVAGIAESLLKSADGNKNAEGTRLAAEQLAAARQIMQLASEVVREVRVRVYEDLPEGSVDSNSVMSHFDEQLSAGNWENVVRVRDDNDSVRVSLLRSDGAIRGAFIVVADGSDLVLANVVADVSPENVKKLTSAAARIGLENGLQQVIEAKLRELPHRLPPPEASRAEEAPPRIR
jgi:hypothetical protein